MADRLANDPTDAGPTLNGAISTTPAAGTQETWTLSSTGTPLPAVFPYKARIDDSATTPDTTVEIVKVTAHPSGTTATVERGAEGSTIKAHANGAKFRNMLTGGLVDTLIPLFVRKTSDETVTSSTALQNDDELLLALEKNAIYTFEGNIVVEGATAADIKVAFTVPAGASVYYSVSGAAVAATAQPGTGNLGLGVSSDDPLSFGTVGAAVKSVLVVRGIVVMSTTAGNLQFRWAQDTSNGTANTVLANSWLSAQKRN